MSFLEIIIFILIIVATVMVIKSFFISKDMEKFNSLREDELSEVKNEAFKVIEKDLEGVPEGFQELLKEDISNEIEEMVPHFSEENINEAKRRSASMVKMLTIVVWLFITMLLSGLFLK